MKPMKRKSRFPSKNCESFPPGHCFGSNQKKQPQGSIREEKRDARVRVRSVRYLRGPKWPLRAFAPPSWRPRRRTLFRLAKATPGRFGEEKMCRRFGDSIRDPTLSPSVGLVTFPTFEFGSQKAHHPKKRSRWFAELLGGRFLNESQKIHHGLL